MDFLLGCNYWASNAGAEMWRDFDPEVIDDDLRRLAEYGVKCVRAFPNWRDFQPVEAYIGGQGTVGEYTTGGKSNNPYYLDDTMLDRFGVFLDLCQTYGIRVVVGMVTGWMSGRLFIPPALYGKNVLTDPLAVYFTQLYIKGFVSRFYNHPALYAWDLGNECNCMAPVKDRYEAAGFTASVSNAIRACDKTHPILSGMHGLDIHGHWTIADQAMFTDMLTTHPYAIFCEHTWVDRLLSYRTLMHPTAQGKFYADLSGKPSFAEEFGTTGTYVTNNQVAADYLRVNLFSLWANGSAGLLWWCANDQNMLKTFPYNRCMLELELGMLDAERQPKPVLWEMKRFSDFLGGLDFTLPPAATDAVCLLTRHQDQWGVGYMTDLLLRRVGVNCRFAYGDDPLPDAPLYLLPSVNEYCVMPMERYAELKKKVREGADLYLSVDAPFLADFKELTGLEVVDSYQSTVEGSATLAGRTVAFVRERTVLLRSVGAKVLATDAEGNPFASVFTYGKGRVFFVNAPMEKNLLSQHGAFEKQPENIYRTLLGKRAPVSVSGEDVIFTYHPTEDGCYLVLINTGDREQSFTVECDVPFAVEKVYYGSKKTVKPYDACVLRLSVKNGKENLKC